MASQQRTLKNRRYEDSDENDNPSLEIRGRDLMNGVPKELIITGNKLLRLYQNLTIIEAVKTLETTPPELSWILS